MMTKLIDVCSFKHPESQAQRHKHATHQRRFRPSGILTSFQNSVPPRWPVPFPAVSLVACLKLLDLRIRLLLDTIEHLIVLETVQTPKDVVIQRQRFHLPAFYFADKEVRE